MYSNTMTNESPKTMPFHPDQLMQSLVWKPKEHTLLNQIASLNLYPYGTLKLEHHLIDSYEKPYFSLQFVTPTNQKGAKIVTFLDTPELLRDALIKILQQLQ